jgi:hypothetical protein
MASSWRGFVQQWADDDDDDDDLAMSFTCFIIVLYVVYVAIANLKDTASNKYCSIDVCD